MIFRDQLRIEARLTVAWHVDHQLARIRHRRLTALAVAGVARTPISGQVMVHCRVQRSLGQRLLQCIKQSSPIER